MAPNTSLVLNLEPSWFAWRSRYSLNRLRNRMNLKMTSARKIMAESANSTMISEESAGLMNGSRSEVSPKTLTARARTITLAAIMKLGRILSSVFGSVFGSDIGSIWGWLVCSTPGSAIDCPFSQQAPSIARARSGSPERAGEGRRRKAVVFVILTYGEAHEDDLLSPNHC